MKKVFLFLTVLLIAISLASCGDTGNQNGTDDPSLSDDFDTSKVTLTSAYTKAQNLGFEGTLDEFIELISGNDGKDGANGKDGVDGADGVSIENVEINADGELLVILSSGKTINCGKVKGADGKDGTDGNDGAPGKDGEDGKDGADAVSPTIEISDDGYWVINGVKTEYKAIGWCNYRESRV